MSGVGACIFGSSISLAIRRHPYQAPPGAPGVALSSTRRFAFSMARDNQQSSAPARADNSSQKGRLPKGGEPSGSAAASPFMEDEGSSEAEPRRRSDEFFNLAKDLMIGSGGGPPRWFAPMESRSSSRLNGSPLLLYLPGIDGTGAGLASQHKKLGKIFEVWCLHIPVTDRTPFTDLVKIIERTVKSETLHSPNKPIYLVGESLGACLALTVAARNPDLDLMLLLANPATSFNTLQMQSLVPLLEIMPDQVQLMLHPLLSLMRGDPLEILMANSDKLVLPPQESITALSKDHLTISSQVSVLADILPKRTLLWKLQIVKSASAFTNSRLHAVKAQTLILISEKDQLLPSQAEASRLYRVLHRCEFRRFEEKGHFLFLEDDIDLVTIIKCACFYRRGKNLDYVGDYLPPTYSEFIKICESNRLISDLTAPAMLSTAENGKVIRGLAGIPSEGPVLFVGYHMLLGLELVPLVIRILIERNIHVRGLAHPFLFVKYKEGVGSLNPSFYDLFRIMGSVPVSGQNLFQLLSRKSHILLYPGVTREALHRKGEEYKLFWPEQAEFVRMAAHFGAKIVPFGVVGEDDLAQVIVDYEDLMKIPYLKDWIREMNNEIVNLRTSAAGEVANQDFHLPGIMPKIPGRFYYLFGKPIETKGRKQELVKDRKKSHDLYLEVKCEVEKCIGYLKEKREADPYRNIFSRLAYQTMNGSSAEIPTFDL